MNNADEGISDLEDRVMEIFQSRRQIEGKLKKKNGSNIRDLLDSIKLANLHIIWIPEGEERKKGIETVFEEIMPENFPNLKKETDIDRGSIEGPKQDEPKQTYTKIYDLKNVKN